MKLLLLGGTTEGRLLAKSLFNKGVPLVYSIAGLVRQPDLPCEVVSGGFSQFGGLNKYIKRQGITHVLDVTHPYAVQMSRKASGCGITYWRFERPPWQPKPDERWFDIADLVRQLEDKKSVMFTVGQITPELVNTLPQGQKQLLRTAVKPKFDLPANITWIKAIGPFKLADEITLMKDHGVDALISKNSGGEATRAKLEAARQLGIPVYMKTRPAPAKADKTFNDLIACERFVLERLRQECNLITN